VGLSAEIENPRRRLPVLFSPPFPLSSGTNATKRTPRLTRMTAVIPFERGTMKEWLERKAANPQNATAAYKASAAAAPQPIRLASSNSPRAARDTTKIEIGPASGVDPKNPNASAIAQMTNVRTSAGPPLTGKSVARNFAERVEVEPAENARANEGESRREDGLIGRAVDSGRKHEGETLSQEAAEG
jgi:hypothetical protein